MSNRFSQYSKKSRSHLWDMLMPVLFFAAIILLFFQGIAGISETNQQEQLRSATNAVTRATIQCYALEGQYPPDIRYLEENYGLSVDQKKYIIHYSAFASNIMPQITVLPQEF